MFSDSIADLLTRIRNASAVKKKTVDVPYSKLKADILSIIKKQGFITDYKLTGKKPKQTLTIKLKYQNQRPAITNLIRLSKPGVRLYTNVKQLPQVMRGRGSIILSTSKGIMTAQQAKKQNLGGEIICKIK